MGKNLIRPDGSILRVESDEEAQKLQVLGYREESPTQELERGITEAQEAHYSTMGQQVLTGVEGFVSGLTLGGSDLLLDSEETRERARYNPGTRLASELVGGLAPLAVTGGGSALAKGAGTVAKFTPAGLASRGALGAGKALGRGSATIEAGIAGVVEGAAVGAGQAVTSAQLTGDPLTAESIAAGIGWGALYGGGLATLGAGLASKFEDRAARASLKGEEALGPTRSEIVAKADLDRAVGEANVHRMVSEDVRARESALASLQDGHYGHFHGAISDAAGELKKVQRPVVETSGPTGTIELRPLRDTANAVRTEIVDTGTMGYARKYVKSYTEQLSSAQHAAKEGRYEDMVGHLEKFKEQLARINGELSGDAVLTEKITKATSSADASIKNAQTLMGAAKLRVDTATAAAEELTRISALGDVLSRFPKTAEEFAGMTAKRVEVLSAAVDDVGKLKSAELAGVQQAVRDSVEELKLGLGVKMEGTPGAQVQGIHRLLREARGKWAGDAARAAKEGRLLWDRAGKAEDRASRAAMGGDMERVQKAKAGGSKASWAPRYLVGSWAAQRAGGGMASSLAYVAGSKLAGALVNFKGAVLGAISDKANKWIPKVGRGLQKGAPRVEPLLTRLDGMVEQKQKDRQALMKARAVEIQQAAPAIRDTLYRAIQPLAISNPELAAAIHKHGVARFQFLLSKMPKDPGLAFSNLKSLWKPDPVAVEKFARYYEVFQNPVAVMTRAIESGRITLEAAEGLREMDPELFSYMRGRMLERIADPEVMGKMKYDDQVHMGILLDLPLHSTMDPRFIAPQQQMYTERNQPLEMNPRIQPGGGAGRPSGPGPSATSSQKITEH